MSRKVLICGASSGLGKSLLDLYQVESHSKVIGVARTLPDECNSEFHTLDITNIQEVNSLVELIKDAYDKLDIIIYCCSAWGESEKYSSLDISEFIKPGPLAFLDLVRTLLDKNVLSERSSVISIGSTATLKNDSAMYGSNTPVYTMSKEIQRYISYDLQRQFKDTRKRFTTLTVGGLGEGRIPATDIKKTIDCISSLSSASKPFEIILPGRQDIVGN